MCSRLYGKVLRRTPNINHFSDFSLGSILAALDALVAQPPMSATASHLLDVLKASAQSLP